MAIFPLAAETRAGSMLARVANPPPTIASCGPLPPTLPVAPAIGGGGCPSVTGPLMPIRPRWILRPDELADSPSHRDGISAELEKGYRRKTCFFIDECGIKLKL